ncbi:MAG: hypothetical protein RLZZ502_465, partial [Pseudomonadota bacterium]
MRSIMKSFKLLSAAAAVSAVMLLTGCGGGGSEGAPFNPSPTQPPV